MHMNNSHTQPVAVETTDFDQDTDSLRVDLGNFPRP
jgi:hypothetical protein